MEKYRWEILMKYSPVFKGLYETGDVGLHLSYFIGNYKGGRNESFMYRGGGGDNPKLWHGYDLVSAYTTPMANLSVPDYTQGFW